MDDIAPALWIAIGIQIPAYGIPEFICPLRVIDAHQQEIQTSIAINIGDGGTSSGSKSPW